MDVGDITHKEKPSDWVQWAKDTFTDDSNIVFLALEEGTKLVQRFELNAFLHGRDVNEVNTNHVYKATINE